MIELGLTCLLTAIIIGFSKMTQGNKFSYMLLFMIIGFGMIIGNKFIPTITTSEYYISETFLEKPDVQFYRPMLILKVIHDRPFTFIGDREEYVIDLYEARKGYKNDRKSSQKKPSKHPLKNHHIIDI